MDGIERAKELLRKLRMRTEERGATAGEAAAAAELAARIIERYGLDGFDAESTVESAELSARRMPGWAVVLAMAMRDRFEVEPYYVRGGGKNVTVIFRGAEHRAAVACWLFRAVLADLQSGAQRAAQIAGARGAALVRFRNCFLKEAAWQVWFRLAPPCERVETHGAGQCDGNGGQRGRRRKRKSRGITEQDWHAANAGRLAGKAVSLDTDVIGDRRARQPVARLVDRRVGKSQGVLF